MANSGHQHYGRGQSYSSDPERSLYQYPSTFSPAKEDPGRNSSKSNPGPPRRQQDRRGKHSKRRSSSQKHDKRESKQHGYGMLQMSGQHGSFQGKVNPVFEYDHGSGTGFDISLYPDAGFSNDVEGQQGNSQGGQLRRRFASDTPQPVGDPNYLDLQRSQPSAKLENRRDAGLVGKLLKEVEYLAVVSKEEDPKVAAEKLGLHTIREVRLLRQAKQTLIAEKGKIQDQAGHPPGVLESDFHLEQSGFFQDTEHLFPSTHQRNAPSRQLSFLWRSQLLSSGRPPLKGINKWKYERSREWKRRKRNIREFFGNFNIWQGSFKTIEGNFGSSVVSYFQFLKWLFLLNVFTCLCILGTVVLPQALMAPRNFNDTLYMGNTQGVLSGYQAISAACSQNYTDNVIQNTGRDAGSRIIDFFQGTGYMENTYLFIGYYFNKTQLYLESSPVYNMPVAYLLSTGAYLIVTLILMVRYTADGVKEKLISKGDQFYKASSMVFCGWDYTLSQEKASVYKHQNLHQEFVRELKKQKRDTKWKNMPSSTKCRIYFVRVLVNLLTLVILTACAALIYFAVEVWKPELLDRQRVKDNNFLTLLVEFLPSFTITALNLIFPFLLQKIVLVERYTPGAELKITIIRTVFLRLASLVVLAVTLLRLISCPDEEKFCGNCNKINCWETYVGQELYKLVILDFFVVLATTFLVEFPRNAIIKAVPKLEFFHQEFDLPVNVLNIVYAQTLSWWGGFYSPLIPAVTVVKLFVFFYCKKVSLLFNQLPPSRPYRASKSNHFFMIILLISFALSGLAIAYSIGKIPPSQGCSPFRIYSRSDYKIFHCVTDAVDTFPSIVRELFYFIASWIFYMVLIVIIILCIYYYSAKTSGSKKVVDLLKEQLALVETDKQFLLKRVNEALQPAGSIQ